MRFGPAIAVTLAFALAGASLSSGSCSRGQPPAGTRPTQGSPAADAPVRRRVSFRASDGVAIAAWLYPAARRDASAVVLAHHLSGDRNEWDAFVREARRAAPPLDATFLAIDLRGHGESTRAADGSTLDYQRFRDEDWRRLEEDLKAAVVYLRSGIDVAPAHVALVGASIGSSAALLAAAHDPTIAACVALSPGLEYHGLDTREAASTLSRRAVLYVAARGDAYSAESAEALHALSRGSESRIYEDAHAHGVALAAEATDLWARVTAFLRPRL